MKCAKCGDTRHTVAEIRGCVGCQDGTVNQVPAEAADNAAIESVIGEHNGLGNRFRAGGEPAPEAPEPEKPSVEPAAETKVEAKAAPKKKRWFGKK